MNRQRLNEDLPAMVPTYPVNLAGQQLTLRFDTNINKTKKGVKLQFVLKNPPTDPRELQTLANKIGTNLQSKFAAAGLQVIYDTENPYKNVVGFLIPLTSLSDYLVKKVIKGGDQGAIEQPEQEAPEEEEPESQLPEKPVAEGRIKLIDLLK